MKKKVFGVFSVMFAMVASVAMFVGCGVKEKTFSVANGQDILSVSLTSEFSDLTSQMGNVTNLKMALGRKDFTYAYIFCEGKQTIEDAGYNFSEMSEEEYAQLFISSNNLSSQAQKDEESGTIFVTYSRNSGGNRFLYYAVLKKGSTGFWSCQFACYNAEADDKTASFAEWAKTVKVETSQEEA